jgi:plastocyanin
MRRALFFLFVAAVAFPASATGGTLTGRVVFHGEPPVLQPVEVAKDREVCGPTIPAQALVVAPGTRGVRYAVVAIEGATAPAAPEPPEATLENQQCRFVPHVLAMRVGAELAIVNGDPVLHNLRAWPQDDTRRAVFNVVQPTQGQVTRRTIKRAGVMALTCDAHLHMSGWVLAFDHPYFAVTNGDGEFTIAGVPAGRYRVTVWHEGWNVVGRTPEGRLLYDPPHVLSQDVTLTDTDSTRVDFVLPAADRR